MSTRDPGRFGLFSNPFMRRTPNAPLPSPPPLLAPVKVSQKHPAGDPRNPHRLAPVRVTRRGRNPTAPPAQTVEEKFGDALDAGRSVLGEARAAGSRVLARNREYMARTQPTPTPQLQQEAVAQLTDLSKAAPVALAPVFPAATAADLALGVLGSRSQGLTPGQGAAKALSEGPSSVILGDRPTLEDGFGRDIPLPKPGTVGRGLFNLLVGDVGASALTEGVLRAGARSAARAAPQVAKGAQEIVDVAVRRGPAMLRNEAGVVGPLNADFYSRLERAIEGAPFEKGTADQWQAALTRNVAAGERQYAGIDSLLEEARGEGRNLSKEELREVYRKGQIRLKESLRKRETLEEQHARRKLLARAEVELQDADAALNDARARGVDAPTREQLRQRFEEAQRKVEGLRRDSAQDDPKFEGYTEPGGENYREVLITLPEVTRQVEVPKGRHRWVEARSPLGRGEEWFRVSDKGEWDTTPYPTREAAERAIREQEVTVRTEPDPAKNYESPHFPERNILAHARVKDRTGPNGEKVLFVEELQSDWMQALREGKEGVPPGPFSKTEDWVGLTMKRLIDEAVKGGYDRIAWTPGAMQVARYDLRKFADEILYEKKGSGIQIAVRTPAGKVESLGVHSESDLSNVVGRRYAKEILGNESGKGRIKVEEGAIGGEGMSTFYDQILPKWVRDYGKKLGVKIEVEPSREILSGLRPISHEEYVDRYGFDALRDQLHNADDTAPWYAIDPEDGEIYSTASSESGALRMIQVQEDAWRKRGIQNGPEVPSFRITPELREKISTEGQPLYSIGADVLARGLRTEGGQTAAFAGAGAAWDEEDPARGALLGAGVRQSPRIIRGLMDTGGGLTLSYGPGGAQRALRSTVTGEAAGSVLDVSKPTLPISQGKSRRLRREDVQRAREAYLGTDLNLTPEGKKYLQQLVPHGGKAALHNFTDAGREEVRAILAARGVSRKLLAKASDQRLLYMARELLERGTKAEEKRLTLFSGWDEEGMQRLGDGKLRAPLRNVNLLVAKLRQLERGGYRRWYQSMRNAVADRRGLAYARSPNNPYENDLQLWMRLLTATSAGNKVEANIRQADKLLSLISQGRIPEIWQQGWGRLRGDTYHNNIRRVLEGEPFSILDQPKFHSFEGNLLGDLDSGTVDEFATAQMGFGDSPSELQRQYIVQKYWEAAERLGWDVAEVQAAAWVMDDQTLLRQMVGGGQEAIRGSFALPLLRGSFEDRLPGGAYNLMQESRAGGYVVDPLGSSPSSAQVREFTTDVQAAIIDPETGEDLVQRIVRQMNPDAKPSYLNIQRIPAAGAYESKVNPNVGVGIHPQTPREMVKEYMAGQGLLQMQSAQYQVRMLSGKELEAAVQRGEPTETTVILVREGRPITDEEYEQLYQIIAKDPELRVLSGGSLIEGRPTFSNIQFLTGLDDGAFKAKIEKLVAALPNDWGVVDARPFTSTTIYQDGPSEMVGAFRGRPEGLRELARGVREVVLPVYLKHAAATGADAAAVERSVRAHADWLDQAADALKRGDEPPPHPGLPAPPASAPPSSGAGGGSLVGNESGGISKELMVRIARTMATSAAGGTGGAMIPVEKEGKTRKEIREEKLRNITIGAAGGALLGASPQTVVLLRKANLLTNVKTQVRNFAANSIEGVFEQLDQPLAAALDKLTGAATGQRTKDFDLVAQLTASRRAMKGVLSDVKDIMRGRQPQATALSKAEIASGKTAAGETAEKMEIPEHFKTVPVVQAYLDLVFRGQTAGDRIFRSVAFQRSLEEQARVLAKHGGKVKQGSNTVTIKPGKVDWRKLAENPTPEMMSIALADAEYAVFQNRSILGTLATAPKQALAKVSEPAAAAAEVVAPFTKTPGAIGDRILARTPVGLLGSAADLFRLWQKASETEVDREAIRALQKRFSERTSRAATGTLALMIGYQLAQQGKLSAPESQSRGEFQTRTQIHGEQPNAIQIDGRWYRIDGISPVGNLIVLGGAAWYYENDPQRLAETTGRVITSTPFFEGTSDAIEAISGGGLDRLAAEATGGMVPSLVAAGAQTLDPVVRDTRGDFLGPLKNRVPGLRETLPPRVNPLGDVLEQDESTLRRAWENFLNPASSREDRRAEDALAAELARVGANVISLEPEEGESREEYAARQMVVGRLIRKALEEEVQGETYQGILQIAQEVIGKDPELRELGATPHDLAKGILKERLEGRVAGVKREISTLRKEAGQ